MSTTHGNSARTTRNGVTEKPRSTRQMPSILYGIKQKSPGCISSRMASVNIFTRYFFRTGKVIKNTRVPVPYCPISLKNFILKRFWLCIPLTPMDDTKMFLCKSCSQPCAAVLRQKLKITDKAK